MAMCSSIPAKYVGLSFGLKIDLLKFRDLANTELNG